MYKLTAIIIGLALLAPLGASASHTDIVDILSVDKVESCDKTEVVVKGTGHYDNSSRHLIVEIKQGTTTVDTLLHSHSEPTTWTATSTELDTGSYELRAAIYLLQIGSSHFFQLDSHAESLTISDCPPPPAPPAPQEDEGTISGGGIHPCAQIGLCLSYDEDGNSTGFDISKWENLSEFQRQIVFMYLEVQRTWNRLALELRNGN